MINHVEDIKEIYKETSENKKAMSEQGQCKFSELITFIHNVIIGQRYGSYSIPQCDNWTAVWFVQYPAM